MAAIRSKNTKPELVVRRMVHRLGYRFRLNVPELPGRPDIVLARHRKIIEVRGCFWHGHKCERFRIPATRRTYWKAKFARNIERDHSTLQKLRRLGWRVLVVWECDVSREQKLTRRLFKFPQV